VDLKYGAEGLVTETSQPDQAEFVFPGVEQTIEIVPWGRSAK
jgi:hypothetical protein